MAPPTPSELWSECLDDLASQLPPQSFETWFKPIQPAGYSGDRFRLEVPSQFFSDWVEQHYQALLQQVVRSRVGAEVQVVLDVGEGSGETILFHEIYLFFRFLHQSFRA
ncbi:MAG: DnaA N-terminal domain-containing protein [bacterium]